MKGRVIGFFVLLFLFVIALAAATYIKFGSFTGFAVEEKTVNEYNPVFSWRDFNVKIEDYKREANLIKVNYYLNDFSGELQNVHVYYYIKGDGKIISSGQEDLIVPAKEKAEYIAKLYLPKGYYGESEFILEADNGRKMVDDQLVMFISSTGITGFVVSNGAVIMFSTGIMIFILTLIIVKFILEHHRRVSVAQSLWKDRFIELDLN